MIRRATLKYAETDVNRLAVNVEDNSHPTLTLRKADRDIAVGVVNVDTTTIVDDTLDADDGKFNGTKLRLHIMRNTHTIMYMRQRAVI